MVEGGCAAGYGIEDVGCAAYGGSVHEKSVNFVIVDGFDWVVISILHSELSSRHVVVICS